MKRGRGAKDALTGGSGDINPQLLTIHAVQTPIADTSTVVQQPLPIPRYPTSRGKNLVMEFLSFEYFDCDPTVHVGNSYCLVTVTTNPTIFGSASAALQDARLISAWWRGFDNLTSVGFVQKDIQKFEDLTDQAGHGLLVAADNLYFGVYSSNTGQINEMVLKGEYRWKEVGLEEYIGIVQSQQA